jgi:hypothetical protein
VAGETELAVDHHSRHDAHDLVIIERQDRAADDRGVSLRSGALPEVDYPTIQVQTFNPGSTSALSPGTLSV